MKINDKVKYIGSTEDQTRWGGNDSPHGLLIVGKSYTVAEVEEHSWHTKIYLKEFPGKKFNSVCFENESSD